MTLLTSLLTLSLLGLVAAGLYWNRRPPAAEQARRWIGPALTGNLILFFGAQAALLFLGIADAAAEPAVREVIQGGREIGLGTGLAFIGIALPTALSTIAAAMAVGPIGAASLAAIAEKPELFGRTLVYLGLAEGLAIYGLVLSILLLDKL
ncbi:MAG: ATP synthase subunit C [Gammaproteobacteria bacterium]|nr:ATP synthase subunit C [Gammaproteobacteria bacterium]MBU1655240.1 ATP synthase subunit C [Gammaproteobacteria bacterium]MBU1961331.1 ATP synthase subunit C [Gammaproteobacteria bacterium]